MTRKFLFFQHLGFFIVIAIVVTAVAGVVYVTAQQGLRQGANDPQIQIAEDAAAALANGSQPVEVVPRTVNFIDIRRSLAPFITIYDSTGVPLESSGTLNGTPPQPPQGVLGYAKVYGENRITWQPDEYTRIALVVVYSGQKTDRFVAVGRSLRETEIRERNLELMVSLFWFISLIATFILIFLFYLISNFSINRNDVS